MSKTMMGEQSSRIGLGAVEMRDEIPTCARGPGMQCAGANKKEIFLLLCCYVFPCKLSLERSSLEKNKVAMRFHVTGFESTKFWTVSVHSIWRNGTSTL